MKSGAFVMALVLVLSAITIFAAPHATGKSPVRGGPIRINNDTDLKSMATDGDGSPGNPYVIKDISVDANGAGCGIYIGNTTAYFLLGSITVRNATGNSHDYFWNSGIVLFNVTHGRIYQATVSNGSGYGIYVKNSSDVWMNESTLTYNYYGGIYIGNSRDIHVGETRIYNHNTGSGIEIRGGENLNISNCEINGTYNGIYANPMNESTLWNNTFRNNRGDGIALYHSENNTIDMVKIHDNGAIGVEIESSNNVVERSEIYSNGQDGIMIKGNGITVYRNKIHDNKNGIFTNPGQYCTIEENEVYNSSNTGMYINYGSNYNQFISNRIWNNSGVGLYIVSSTHNVVENNIVYNHANEGIEAKDGSHYNTISGNTVHDNKNNIDIYNSNHNEIFNNTVYNGDVGILTMYSQFNNISFNTGYHNNQSIYIIESTNNTIDNNTVNNNYFNGILLYSGFNVVDNNTATNNSDGMYLSGANNCTLKFNILRNNSNGILILKGNWSVIFNNLVENNTYGIRLDDSYNNTIYHNDIINNTHQAYDNGNNTWNLPRPVGGNHWSDYTGADSDGDGFGDTPYTIPGGNNRDELPLVNPAVPEFSPLLIILLLAALVIFKRR